MPTGYDLNDEAAFDADVTNAMGRAFEEVCSTLQLPIRNIRDRQVIAARIIDLARGGVTEADALRDRVLEEARKSA
jgi:hypothetical protein